MSNKMMEIKSYVSKEFSLNIREKLRFIEQIQQPRIKEPEIPHLRAEIDQVLEGEVVATQFGPSFVKTIEFDIQFQHGIVQLRQVEEISPYFLKLAGKDENLLQLDLSKAMFFDTETTGLAGGSGTHIFLLGLGFFSNDKFIVKQFFMRDFPEEPAMLHLIHELMNNFESFISFNGKSFDVPLLKTRFTYHRIKSELDDLPHLDLLHAARRIWKRRLTDCSLSSLEQQILHVSRTSDIPSYLIPHTYFEYLRTKNAHPIKKIFYHNEIDILSLVSLTILLNNIHKQPVELLPDKMDLITLTKHYENTNQWQRNIPIYQSLLAKGNDREIHRELKLRLSFCYKHLGDWDQAVSLWQELIATGGFVFEAYEELAKYYEHRTLDLNSAEHIVTKALASLDIIEQIKPEVLFSTYRENLSHRLNRIQRKKQSGENIEVN
ncbi:MAG TPA: ribonuclease H-like domain-containing protein [bacterium]